MIPTQTSKRIASRVDRHAAGAGPQTADAPYIYRLVSYRHPEPEAEGCAMLARAEWRGQSYQVRWNATAAAAALALHCADHVYRTERNDRHVQARAGGERVPAVATTAGGVTFTPANRPSLTLT